MFHGPAKFYTTDQLESSMSAWKDLFLFSSLYMLKIKVISVSCNKCLFSGGYDLPVMLDRRL